MTRIRCRDSRCTFWKKGICSSEEIEYDPDAGCLTMEPREDLEEDEDEEWEEGEEEEGTEEEEESEDEEDEEDWEEDAD